MFGSVTRRRFVFTAVAPGAVGGAANVTVSVAITSGGLAAGDIVVVTPRAAVAAGVTVYGIIIDATHIGLVFCNGTAGSVTPASATYDVAVDLPTGPVST